MTRSLAQHIIRVSMVATLIVAVAEAQSGAGSDHTGPGGGGSGVGGNVAPYIPKVDVSSFGMGALQRRFADPNPEGVKVSNPAGGLVTIAPATCRAIAAVFKSGDAAATQNLLDILVAEGFPAGAAGAMTNALSAFGSNPIRATLVAALQTFNAVIDTGPNPPPLAMLAIRFALATSTTWLR